LAPGIGPFYDPVMMWFFFLLVLLIPLMAVVLDSQLGRALARRVEGSATEVERLAALESEVDRLSRELETLQEQSDFINRLLDERARGRLTGGDGD
jgi:cell division protein FtsB